MKCSPSLRCSTLQINLEASSKTRPKKFWKDKSNHRAFLDRIAHNLNIKSFEDWYQKSYQDVVSQGGRVLLNNYYNSSLANALESIYPEYTWQRWKFKEVRLPRGFWNNEKNIIAYLKYLSEHLSITNVQDWSLLTKDYVERSGGRPLLKKYGGLIQLLKRFIPGYSPTSQSISHQKSISRSVSKGQGRLLKVVASIFPNEEVLCDYKHPKVINLSTYTQMELDIFVPKYNLAFEYQGEQHYSWHYLYGSNVTAQLRDAQKKKLCNHNNITLIEIPFWWDREKDSVMATIHQVRPDIVPHSIGTPVNLSKVPNHIQKLQELSKTLTATSVVPGLPFWQSKKSPVGWWLLQVPKGIHCLWNGTHFVLQNGSAVQIAGPYGSLDSWLQRTLPSHQLEGILFSDSQEDANKFQFSKSQIRIQHPESLRFFAVDLPPPDSEQILGYEERLSKLQSLQTPADSLLPLLLQLPQPVQCDSIDHFSRMQTSSDENAKWLWLFRPRTIYLQRPSASFQVQSSIPQPSADGTEQILHPDGRSYAPYVATEGSPIGAIPKCRGCRKSFSDRKEIRIEVRGVFIPGDKVPYRTKYSFCASSSCVEKALHSLGSSAAIRLPAFDGKVGVAEEIKDRVLATSGIQWVTL